MTETSRMTKCSSHDDCFERLYDRIERLEQKQDTSTGLLRDLLHETKLMIQKHDLQLEQVSSKLADRKTDWSAFFLDLLKDAVRFGFFAGGAAAWWALRNGYPG